MISLILAKVLEWRCDRVKGCLENPNSEQRIVGVFFSYNSDDANNLNFGEKIRKLEKTLNSWKRRKLTLHGRLKK